VFDVDVGCVPTVLWSEQQHSDGVLPLRSWSVSVFGRLYTLASRKYCSLVVLGIIT